MTVTHSWQGDELLTPAEVSVVLRTAVSTLSYWRRMGTGPAWLPLGRRVAYSKQAIQDYIARQQALGEATQRERAS